MAGRQAMLAPKCQAQKVRKAVTVPPARSRVLGARPFQSKVAAAEVIPTLDAKVGGGWPAGRRVPGGRTTGCTPAERTAGCDGTGDGKEGRQEHCQRSRHARGVE